VGRTLYVASGGGHLDELIRLSGRLTGVADAEWCTYPSAQAEEELGAFHRAPEVKPKDLRAALRAVPGAYTLLGRGYDRVVSTGAAVAVPYAIAARARGVRFHYIESAARSHGPSLAGRLIQRIPGTRLYTQHAAWAGRRWLYRGSTYDGFAPGAPAPVTGALGRVVVTFGTQRFPFRRAAEALVKLLPEVCAPDAEILWQTGYTDVSDLGIAGAGLVAPAELRAAIAEADLVISHSGIGGPFLALDHGRVPLLLIRSAAHGEHTDEHQTLIANSFAVRSLALARRPDELTADDLLEAAALRAAPVADPPAFELLPD
jgi:UDP-N-acetylglucosamine transferase subunit ALG13